MANQPIPVSEANDMIQAYLEYMTRLGVDMSKQTHSVSFTAPELSKWMETVKSYTDEYRMCLGVYPGGENAGRMTVIVWPYKNGKPATKPDTEGKSGGGGGFAPPYNQGQLNP